MTPIQVEIQRNAQRKMLELGMITQEQLRLEAELAAVKTKQVELNSELQGLARMMQEATPPAPPMPAAKNPEPKKGK